MELRRLALRNLRSYTDAIVEFGPGTTLVAGDVGSGKTSLLYAVEMALFGFAEVEDAAHVVRHQASDAEVSLSLTDGDRTFELRRRFIRRHRKGRESFDPVENSFRQDGARTQYSATELRQRAIDLLGFPDNPNPRSHSDLWRWAVYVPQERMREVLDQDPDERLETVRKALGVEQYRTAADNAQEVASELRKRAEIRAAEAERLTHWVEEVVVQSERVAEARASASRARGVDAELRAAIRTADERLADLARARRQVDADQREADAITAERTAIERGLAERGRVRARREADAARVATEVTDLRRLAADEPRARAALAETRGTSERLHAVLEARRSEAQVVAVLQTRADGVATRLRAAEGRVGTARREVQGAESELDRLSREAAEHEPVSPVPDDLASLERDRGAAQIAVDARRSELARAEHESSEIASLVAAGVCPRCHQPVTADGFRDHASEAERAVAEARARVEEAVAVLAGWDAARSARERFEREHERWLETEKRRSQARSAIEAARGRLSAAESEQTALGSERDQLSARLVELSPVGDTIASVTAEVGRIDARLAELQAEAERTGRAAAQTVGLEGQLDAIRQELERLRAEDRADGERGRELAARREAIAIRLAQTPSLAESEAQAGRELVGLRSRLDGAVAEIARAEQAERDADRRRAEAEEGAAERAALGRESEHLRQLAAWFAAPFREAALRLERQMLGQAHREFERAFTRYFGTLIEDASLIARLDAHFAPYAEVDGEWTPPAALSGGERTALALAYRLALGGVVRAAGRLRLATLILDEPTDGFSPEQVGRMGELLEELALPQVILVSHEAGLGSVADRVVRVTKSGGVSAVAAERAADPPLPGGPVPEPVGRPRRRRTLRLDESPAGG